MAPVLVEATLDTDAPVADLFSWVDDLSRYAAWLDLVRSAERSATGPDGSDAWEVVLSARIGPLRRSKRLRMVRTEHESTAEGGRVRFERGELDEREHAAWVLDATVRADGPSASRLYMTLRYDGGLWGPLLEPVLNEQIATGKRNLALLVARPA